jgi:hypothetical protein
MAKRTLYLKGYKLDRQKIRSRFPIEDYESEDNYELNYYRPIVINIPETAYKYVGWWSPTAITNESYTAPSG